MKAGITLGSFLVVMVCNLPPVQAQANLTTSQSQSVSSRQYVPDKATAIKIAEAVWLPIYGKKIYKEKPFNAVSKGTSWIVEGSLPEGMEGGVVFIEINKADGRIVRVTHGK
ncbi:YbbC/YhhH family protein [Hymenobacter perfusus]|uniref:NTF2 fold domain-containing protein n=1 Tax=Hymenobacter perfusus TaxID=1236770 RepID=A0A3R9MD10_9BACT|nr:YbbC/YhhH family protein [Hymenobacter perfusus]RSK42977.1 hypothetical protein EI293_14400 [Hymenobacter perfusus]